MSSYKKLDGEYRSKMYKALDREDWETASKLEEELNERVYKEIYKPLINAGYDYMHSSIGSDGLLGIQFGKRLSEVEYDKYGCERFVDDFFIETGDMKVYRTEDW